MWFPEVLIPSKGLPNNYFPIPWFSKNLPGVAPVLEEKWIPNWQYDLIYSDSGVNETDCIFTEQVSGLHILGEPLTTTWNTVVHDPENCKIKFLLILEDRGVIGCDVDFEENQEGISTVTWHMVFTSLSSKNESINPGDIQKRMSEMLDFLASLLKGYCEKTLS